MSMPAGWVVFGYKNEGPDGVEQKERALSAPMGSQNAAENYRELCIREGYVVTTIRYQLPREDRKNTPDCDIPKWRGLKG